MKKNIPALLAHILVATLLLSIDLSAQNIAPYWSLSGNSNATLSNVLGNKGNVSLRIITNNKDRIKVMSAGNIGIGTSSPNASALLDLTSTTRGVLFPRMTSAQRDAIASPSKGLMIFQTDGTAGLYYYNAGWKAVGFVNNAPGANSMNVFIGANSGASITTGVNNTATGDNSLQKNTSGSFNAAFGAGALNENVNGISNTAVGTDALRFNTADENTAVGHYSMHANSTGQFNTAAGAYSMSNSSTGMGNTAYGYATLIGNTTGRFNTALGNFALYNNTTGEGNTLIGSSADVAYGDLINATAIGQYATATASNQVTLGGNSVTSVRSAANITVYSDGRFKKNRKENVPGMDFINELRPVTYTYDIHALNSHIGIGNTRTKVGTQSPVAPDEKAINEKEKIVYTGFIAQEVEAAAKKLNYDFSGVYTPRNDKDAYALSYADFVTPLVKAAQELDKENKLLKTKTDSLQDQVKILTERLNTLEQFVLNTKDVNGGYTKKASGYLETNSPNPFKGATSIRYYVPENSTQAQIIIADAKGVILQKIPLMGKGKGQLNINAIQWASGIYNYSLHVDGKKVETLQMIIAR